jgi:nitroreductase
MKTIEKDFLISQLNWRYAVKKFDNTKKIAESDWNILEEVLRLTPSSYGLQPWKFLIVQNPEVRKKLTPVSWGQSQVEDCSHYVVLATLKKMDESYVDNFMKTIADTRGVPVSSLDGFKKNIVSTWVNGPQAVGLQAWTQRQSYIAMGSLMTAAALMGIDTTPMEGFDPLKYDEILNLKDSDYKTVAAVACGYRHSEDPLARHKKVRFHRDFVFQTI